MYHSMKNYNPKWLNNIQSCEIHPAFIPCDHDEPCAEETCSCVQNKFFCNKACGWGSKSRNFFRGCACKAGQCRSSTCPCWAGEYHDFPTKLSSLYCLPASLGRHSNIFVANRECDPGKFDRFRNTFIVDFVLMKILLHASEYSVLSTRFVSNMWRMCRPSTTTSQ